jgi:osmotically inducible lipoprotein OsmB
VEGTRIHEVHVKANGKGISMRQLMRVMLAGSVVLIIALGGCAGMNETQQRTLTGGAAGTAGGALIGAIAGNAGMGAAIGAGAGLAGGYLYGKHEDSKKAAYQQGVADGARQSQQPSSR